ncbi:MAG TPA: type IV pili methyl-accepting chemotaxis transducer N-terminal domain-containing protein [Burkholderiaceae bacterium]
MTLAKVPLKLLVAAADEAARHALSADAAAAGMSVIGATDCSSLVRGIPDLEPDCVVMQIARPDAPLFSELAGWLARTACPLLVLVEHSEPQHTEQAVQLGVAAWVVGRYAPSQLAALVQLARARWRRDGERRAQLDAVHRQLDDRKWVERAKGVLMAAQAIGEDEAYRLLRNAAMQRQSRLGEVSRTVIDASNWAEAVNRAGQLRMLSQRLVRVFAQRLARVGVRRAAECQDESLQRMRENIARLQALLPEALRHAALTPVVQAWQALQTVIEGRLHAAAVTLADECAEVLLQAAEHLTRALEVAGGRRVLHVVNQSGRQRMLAQRVAKLAMVALATDRAPAAQPLNAAVDAFEATLNELERAPLSSELIRSSLAAARDEWLRMMRSVAACDQMAERAACAAASDALVQIFDRLTEHYQRSLEALMG